MLTKKRVIIIGPAWPYRGGLASYNERLAREYQSRGHDVVIITFTLQYPDIFFPGKSQYIDSPEPEDLTIRRMINSVNPFSWIKTGFWIKNWNPDLVIIRYWLPFMAPALGTIARIARMNRLTRIIGLIDNIIPHEKRVGDTFFTRYFIKPANAFLVMSETVKGDTRFFDKKKPIGFCPHPVYDNFGNGIGKLEAKKKLGLEVKTKYALFFGFIRDYKGLDLAIRAFAEKELRELDVNLLVAGEFYCKEGYYRQIIKDLNLEDRIEVRDDFIADEDVRYYFSAVDVVLQPYKSATQSGITQIAYHFNRPMIVTNVGGLPEIVPDGKVGFVVDRNPVAIANAFRTFYERNLEKEFSSNAAIEKEKYSWKRMIETIDSLCRLETYPQSIDGSFRSLKESIIPQGITSSA